MAGRRGDNMRFVIVGPGALGCLVGAKLAEAVAGNGDVLWILDHDAKRADHINREGILYEKADRQERQERYPVHACADPTVIGRADVLFLCVKSYDLGATLDFCRPLLQPRTLLIFMQNGIGHLDLGDRVGDAIPAFGSTSEGATSLGAGHTRHAGDGMTFLGFLDGQDAASNDLLMKTVSRLQAGGLSVSLSDTIRTRLWAKLFVNVGINALTAIHDCKNGELLSIAEVEREMQGAVAEAERLAVAKGIPIEQDPYQATVAVCRATARNVSSMRQDVLKKRRTEIDAINGAVVREALRYGIATPVNNSLVGRIKKIESDYIL
jgi:2-dehydropantoate 2-reductase